MSNRSMTADETKEATALVDVLADLLKAYTHLHPLTTSPTMIPKELSDALTAIETATSSVASRVSSLVGQVASAPTQAELTDVVSRLSAVTTQLQSLLAATGTPAPGETPVS